MHKRLFAASLGANMQFRFLGGAIGLGVVTAVLNGYIRPRFVSILPEDTLVDVLQSASAIASLPEETAQRVISIYSSGFTLQWKALTAFAGAQTITNLMTA